MGFLSATYHALLFACVFYAMDLLYKMTVEIKYIKHSLDKLSRAP